jgi:YHS domain-containing protein
MTMRNFIVAIIILFSANVLVAGAPKKEPAKPFNTVCPITGDKVSKNKTVTYEGKVYGFCCSDCIKAFNKDPKKVAANLTKDGKKVLVRNKMPD